ncbi:MAG: peptidase S41 [Lysobacter sp.]|nr:peptidase S41 [Lysobacter sp.]
MPPFPSPRIGFLSCSALRRLIAALLLGCAPLASAAQATPSAAVPGATTPMTATAADRLQPAAGLRADVDTLEQAYTRLHPGLYRYNTPRQMAGHFAELRKTFDRDRSLAEAYLAFSRFAAKVRCGHTYANFYNQSEPVAKALFESPDRVPFQFRWLDHRMVITRNLSTDPSLVPGTEVLAIEGVPVARILDRLMTVARADGSNDAKRRAYLEVGDVDRYAAFDIYLPLFFPQVDGTHTLRVRSPQDRRARRVDVPALSYAQRLASVRDEEDKDAPAFELRYTDTGVAVLDMPGWALYDSDWDWRGFLQRTFEELDRRGTPALILDLRRNEGGLSVGDEILGYLTDREVTLPPYRRLVRYRTTPTALRPYLKTWDPSFHDWGRDATETEHGFYRLLREGEHPEGDTIAPKTPRYRGKVYALVGATNSSATFEFAMALRRTGLGRLVGQTTGGNRRGINGGAFFFLHLPNSGIELDLPLVGQFPETPQPDAGLEPDLRVTPRIADIAAGRDAELEAALADFAAHRRK